MSGHGYAAYKLPAYIWRGNLLAGNNNLSGIFSKKIDICNAACQICLMVVHCRRWHFTPRLFLYCLLCWVSVFIKLNIKNALFCVWSTLYAPGILPNECEDGDIRNRPRFTPGSFLIHDLSSFKYLSSLAAREQLLWKQWETMWHSFDCGLQKFSVILYFFNWGFINVVLKLISWSSDCIAS